MATFVLVHDSWGGGWQWRKVSDRLRAAGHHVTTPTLTGLGERAHVQVSRPITLETHIQDLVEHLYFEDLSDVVLVGWSSGSAIVEAAADTVPERVRVVVDLDGHLVAEGELLDGTEPDEIDAIRRSDWIPPPTADDLADVLDDEGLRQHVGARERPHPSATWTARYPDLGGRRRQLRMSISPAWTRELVRSGQSTTWCASNVSDQIRPGKQSNCPSTTWVCCTPRRSLPTPS